jgi:hypothetical protein
MNDDAMGKCVHCHVGFFLECRVPGVDFEGWGPPSPSWHAVGVGSYPLLIAISDAVYFPQACVERMRLRDPPGPLRRIMCWKIS